MTDSSRLANLRFCRFLRFFLGKGRLGLVEAKHIEYHPTDQGEDFRSIVFLDGTGILAGIDIEHPMQLVFHGPPSSTVKPASYLFV